MRLACPPVACVLALTAPALAQEAALPAAEEYVHFDTLKVRMQVQADGTQESTLSIGVLLRNATAVTEFGQIALPYVDGLGEVSFTEITVQKPDGRRVEVRDAKPEDINPYGASTLSVPADIRLRKVTVPGLEPGDRLSYQAIVQQRPLAPNRIFGEMKFTPLMSDPVQVYELDLPREVAVTVHTREGLGASWEDVPAPAGRLVRRLSLRVPRPRPGPDGPTEAEARAMLTPDVVFTTFPSWEEVARWWWTLSRERVTPDASVRAEAVRIVKGLATPREQLIALQTFVASRIRYLSVGFGIGRMQPRPAREVLESRYGDCKDKHALLEALATAVGLQVRPFLVNSVREDLSDAAPSPQQFDHMISVARLGKEPSEWLWMDATNPLGPTGYLTANLRDKRGLLVEPDGRGDLIRTPVEPPFTPRHEVQGKGSLDGSGVLRAHMSWTFRSDSEVMLRSVFGITPRQQHPELVKGVFAKGWKDGKVTNVTFSDPADVSAPFRLEFDAEKTIAARSSEKEWALWIPVPQLELPKLPTPADGREKLAELEVNEFKSRVVIELPAGTTARPPLSVSLERPLGRLQASYSAEGGVLRVERTVTLTQRSVPAAQAEAYESFRKALNTDIEQEFFVAPLAAGVASAEMLRRDGKAAFNDREYGRAVELLRKATASDAKLKGAWNDLGRALRESGDKEGALAAFTRQIEVDPFDEDAHEERAWVLIGLNRWDDAEKDLLKHIEIAPFEDWAYGQLGDRRWGQRRFREAADYYQRAATIDPKDEDHWLDLAWAQMLDGRDDEVRATLTRAQSLTLAAWQQVNAARVYSLLGDDARAGEIAAGALGSIVEKLARLSPDKFDAGDIYWVNRLAEAWQVVGATALAAGDLVKADKYLQASWRMAFLPEAAWSLGLLEERRGRAAEGARWLRAAQSISGSWWRLPRGQAERVAAAPKVARESADSLVQEARMIKLADRPEQDLNEEVLVLIGTDGVVEAIKSRAARKADGFDRQVAKLGRPRLGLPRPDDRPVKLVLGGLLACFTLTNCTLILDVP